MDKEEGRRISFGGTIIPHRGKVDTSNGYSITFSKIKALGGEN
ncbi:MAG: hypothetical protein ACK5JH_04510 [Anaerocolumna sp.]